MTTLGKLRTMKDKDIQVWLRKIGQENVHKLVIAMLGADDDVKNCVYRNMSETARARLKQDVETQKAMGFHELVCKQAAEELESWMS